MTTPIVPSETTVGSSSLQLPFASPSAPTRQAWLRSLKAKQGHTATLPRAVQLPPVALWPQSAPHVSDAWNFCVCRSGYRRTKLQQYHGSPHPRHRSGAHVLGRGLLLLKCPDAEQAVRQRLRRCQQQQQQQRAHRRCRSQVGQRSHARSSSAQAAASDREPIITPAPELVVVAMAVPCYCCCRPPRWRDLRPLPAAPISSELSSSSPAACLLCGRAQACGGGCDRDGRA
jgi:hypothetical protein